MGPKPIISAGKKVKPGKQDPPTEGNSSPIGRIIEVLSAAVTACLVFAFPWARSWLYPRCGILSLLIVYGSTTRATAFRSTPPWTTLASLNLIYSITSTSWLQYRCFTAVCWPCIITTFLLLSPPASYMTRRVFRGLLTRCHFIKDGIAAFNLPALHLDIKLQGLLVVRGWTFSVSTLTIEAHGIELGA